MYVMYNGFESASNPSLVHIYAPVSSNHVCCVVLCISYDISSLKR